MQTRDRLGQQFGNYRLIRLIGSGGSAEVYLAEHIAINNLHHAIKVRTETNLRDEQRVKFLSEARTIANLQHLNAHIMHIYDFAIQTSQNSADNGVPYLVMEYAAEGTLRNRYPHKTRVPLEFIAFYINQVAEALQCVHDQNPPVVHCDIKPENMLLRSRDHLLLSDFGIAFTGDTGLQLPLKEKEIAGTVAYMAPERFDNDIHRASDQYALGVIVYEWLCGTLPFDGTSREIYFKQLMQPPPPLATRYPHITKEIESIVMRALAKKPTDRYPNVEEFAQALEKAVEKALAQRFSKAQSVLPRQIELPNEQPVPQRNAQSPLRQVEPPLQQVEPATRPLSHPAANVAEPLASARIYLSPTRPIATRLATQPERQSWFAFSPQFVRDQRFIFFRNSGFVFNVLSAITLGLLQRNDYILSVGLIFSIGVFLLCIYIVEEKLALFFAAILALYWSFVGWSIGSYIASQWYLNPLLPALFVSCLFFGVSLSLHVWYISRKNA